MKNNKKILPFTSIIGQELLKEALILNAVNQDLMGVIIKGQRGTAKSVAVRAMAELLPEEDFSIDCPYGCSPEKDQPHCNICQEILDGGGKLRAEKRKIRVVTLPLSATEDKVIGSINIEKALKGEPDAFEPGLLAKANRGIIYIDEINLLDDNIVDVLLDSAAMGFNTIEREGISITHPSKFILVGTMNPEEGELRPQLTDRLGLYVDVKGIEDIEQRVKIIDVMEEFDSDNNAFYLKYADEQKKLLEKINIAKSVLPQVRLQRDLKELIAKICVDFGIDGHRADILMSRCSKTIAALEGRKMVEKSDVERAAGFIIPHRVRRDPFDEEQPIQQKLQQLMQEQKQEDNNPQDDENQDKNTDDKNEDSSKNWNENSEDNSKDDLKENNPNFNQPPDGKDNRENDTNPRNGDKQKPEQHQNPGPDRHKKFITAPEISVKRDKKIKTGRGRRAKTLSTHTGKYVKSRNPKSGTTDIAIDATIRSSVISKGRIDIDKNDIREKVREKKKAVTTVFIVDASGSMGVGKRMDFAKGALISMLRDSYQKRDKVGFVVFRGNDAKVILKPTTSVYSAMKKVKSIPTGGKTPLCEGLLSGLKTIMDEIIKDKNCVPAIVLVSDGRANVSKNKKGIKKEIISVSKKIKEKGINLIIIDADDTKLKLGYLNEIIKYGKANYFHINNLINKDFKKSVGLLN